MSETKKSLNLVLKYEWFDKIKSGKRLKNTEKLSITGTVD